ncbi:MAG TPA: protein-L-isoaspartate(D-aspartate) O-methyltransferase [Verrucomicrobiae bacterium]|nr:protein-L-isoaspartate(D-aspartate) O-methyltransferase [Verrucomicrobiae bacterium]
MTTSRFIAMSLSAVLMLTAQPIYAADFDSERVHMVKQQIHARGVTNTQVLAAMQKVPRHEFVPERSRAAAYDDAPLPIGYGQTISQPYIVALMTELLELSRGDKVLEIGTGSGYQAAILAEIVGQIYTIEIIEPLADSAAARLKRLGYNKVEVKFGDGYFGWPKHAPFDAIIVTAAADHVPPPLIEQLKPGGRMVIPLGSVFFRQTLVLVEKDTDGKVRTRNIAPVAFVPLTRQPKQ